MRTAVLRAAALLLKRAQRADLSVCDEDEEEKEEETYGSVEKAIVVHGQVEFGLDSLDGHHTEPYWDQVKDGYRSTGGGQGHTVNMAGHPHQPSLSSQSWFNLTVVTLQGH